MLLPVFSLSLSITAKAADLEENIKTKKESDNLQRCLVIKPGHMVKVYDGYRLLSTSKNEIRVVIGSNKSYLYFTRDYSYHSPSNKHDSKLGKYRHNAIHNNSLLKVITPKNISYQVPNKKLLRVADDGIGKISKIIDDTGDCALGVVQAAGPVLPLLGILLGAGGVILSGGNPPSASPSR